MFTNSRRTISVSTCLITPSHVFQSETDGVKFSVFAGITELIKKAWHAEKKD